MTDCSRTYPDFDDEIVAANREALDEVTGTIERLQGEFTLLLLRCNYRHLRELMGQQLPPQVQKLVLDRSTKALFPTIARELGDSQPKAVSIAGLEALDDDDLDTLLGSANVAREEFRRNFRFPLLLWVDDRVFVKLVRLVPDFKSWATTTRFQLPTEAIEAFLRQSADRFFDRVLETGAFVVEPLESRDIAEIELALKELQERDIALEPDIRASLAFGRGRQCYKRQEWDASIDRYDESLKFWEDNANARAEFCVRAGVVRFYRGLAYRRKAETVEDGRAYWETAKTELERGLQQFEAAQRPDLVARFMGELGEVLVQLEAWEELDRRAREWLELHRDDAANLARDWGFLARVAAQRGQWQQVKERADKALAAWERSTPLNPPLVRGETRASSLQYRLLEAQALKELGDVEGAISILEKASATTSPALDPSGYVRVLHDLRDLHYAQKHYVQAFEIKQKCRAIEFQFGFRAFVGAGTLEPQIETEETDTREQVVSVSGRQGDINELANTRIPEDRYKLTVLYGPSGVGKSSLLRAGLLPALQHRAIRFHMVLPVITCVYENWARELGRQMREALEEYPEKVWPETPLESVEELRAQLQRNAENRLLTVLVFDQFEEFFFTNPDLETRQEFYAFLKDCLKGIELQFVKVVLSLREDYLHWLLEFERYARQQGIPHDVLSAEWRYYLGNFSPEAARQVVEELTQRTQQTHRKLEGDLVEQFVEDLKNALGEVRPIELQVVGAQLEADEITRLVRYRELGENPKAQLAERWIAMAVADCGEENKGAAWQVLAALTDEKGTRPLRTKAELEAVLEDYRKLVGGERVSLDEPILRILVGSGLVVRWSQEPEDRYQLVHDYLVELVRRKYNADYRQRLETLAEQVHREESIRKKWQKWTLRGSVAVVVVLSGLAVREALMLRERQISVVKSWIAQAEFYYQDDRQLEAMIASIYALEQAKEIRGSRPLLMKLEPLIYSTYEKHKFIEHRSEAIGLIGLDIHPMSHFIVYSDVDNSIKAWNMEGRKLNTLRNHKGWIRSLRFSLDGKMMVSASDDRTIKVWNVNTATDIKIKHDLNSHSDYIYDVKFSKNNDIIASSTKDAIIEIWDVETGKIRKILRDKNIPKEGNYIIYSVDFHPQISTILASSGYREGSVNLWDLTAPEGKMLQHFGQPEDYHEDIVLTVKFNPDGSILASGSQDGFVKLWNVKDKRLIGVIDVNGRRNSRIYDLDFNSDGSLLATASDNETIKIWNVDHAIALWTYENTLTEREYFLVLRGHTHPVNRVKFSPKDDSLLVSIADDRTVRIWEINTITHPWFEQPRTLQDLLEYSCHSIQNYMENNTNIPPLSETFRDPNLTFRDPNLTDVKNICEASYTDRKH